MARQRHTARRTGFQRTTLDERITPLSQGRNVDVDPVVPPIEAAGIEAEIGAFGWREGGAELFDVKRFENVFVVQDERLEERDEFDYFFEFAFAAGERGLRGEWFDGAIDGLHESFLRWRGEFLITRFRNRDRMEFQGQAVFEAFLRAIVFAVTQACQFDGASHVARIRDRRGELIDALVAARDERGGNQCHAAADEIDGNQVEAFTFGGGELAKESAEKVGKRRGRVDSFVPA